MKPFISISTLKVLYTISITLAFYEIVFVDFIIAKIKNDKVLTS